MLYSLIKFSNNKIRLFKENIMSRISETPMDIRSLFSLKAYLEEIPSHITEMQRMIEAVDEVYDLLTE